MDNQAPALLNDDGSASVATALMMTHHGLRRDLALFTIALQRVAYGDESRVPILKEEWQRYRGVLHGHHEAEDQRLFPHLRGQEPALISVIEALTIEHRRIDPLLDQGDEAFARLPTTEEPVALVAALAALSALLEPHLATEEAKVLPFLREAKAFPAPATDAYFEKMVEGFAWSSNGIAADVLERVHVMLPEVVISKLPAAPPPPTSATAACGAPRRPAPPAPRSRTASPHPDPPDVKRRRVVVRPAMEVLEGQK